MIVSSRMRNIVYLFVFQYVKNKAKLSTFLVKRMDITIYLPNFVNPIIGFSATFRFGAEIG